MTEIDGSVDYEAALILAVVEQADMKSAKKQKIDQSFFYSPVARAAWIFLESYFANPLYKDTPSIETFNRRFPAFPRVRIDESVVALCDHVRDVARYEDIAGAITNIVNVAATDSEAAQKMFDKYATAMRLRHVVDQSRTVSSMIDMVRENYLRMEANPTALKGWAFPWAALNRSTLGAQKGQLAAVYARPKRCKTWAALAALLHFNKTAGVTSVIFSQELPPEEMVERVVALMCGVNYSQFLRGRLPKQERDDFMQDLEIFAENPPVIIDTIQSITGEDAADELRSKMDSYGAQAYLLDGAYKCADDWRDLMKLTSGLKRTCRDMGIWGSLTTQSNKGKGGGKDAGNGDDLAFGDAFMQDCDYGIHLSSDIEDLQARQIRMRIAFIRQGMPVGWIINKYLCGNMSQKAEFSLDGADPDEIPDDSAADEAVEELTKQFSDPSAQEA